MSMLHLDFASSPLKICQCSGLDTAQHHRQPLTMGLPGISFFQKSPAGVVSSHELDTEVDDGSLRYTVEEGFNSSNPTYQEASGAPVESKSPLGYSVGWVTVVLLNLSMMVGTGVFSTRTFLVTARRMY